jgi:hypothetical protein
MHPQIHHSSLKYNRFLAAVEGLPPHFLGLKAAKAAGCARCFSLQNFDP